MRTLLNAFAIFILSTSQMLSQNSGSLNARVDSILSKLTLEQKVKMCHAQSKFSSSGVPAMGIPEIWMSDGPHGVRAEIEWDSWNYAGWTNDSCTAFPALTCLASAFNPALAYQYGKAVGEEARYRKKDILLGPGVNIYRTPLNGRNFEYMGEDPYLASTLVVPYIKGVQSNGVAACVKHFALNNQEVWRDKVNVELSDRALHEIYLPAFKAAVEEGHVWSIMSGYNKVRGAYCSENEFLNNKILKGEWGFDGVVISDWGGAHSTKGNAYNGLDIEMGTGSDGLTFSLKNEYDNYYLASVFLEQLRNGDIPQSVIDDKVRRILRLMLRTNMNKQRDFGSLATKEHADIAQKVAEEGIVLLKNEKNFFPINPSTTQTIAVIGENATRTMTVGGGSSELKAAHEISPLQGVKACFKSAKIIHTMGYETGVSTYGYVNPGHLNQDSLKLEAIKVASKSDIVIFVGGLNKSHTQDCENGDRESYNLPFGQDDLLSEILKVNKNVAVVLVSGNAVAMPWISEVKAVMQAWYGGSEAGTAIANILSGKVNPSGKLPISFPVKLSDNGAISFGDISYPGINFNQTYKEDILVGYRWFDTKKIEPLFEFGFGLSFSTFKIDNIKINQERFSKNDTITISMEISNMGKARGAEVVQIYAHQNKSSVLRPEKELKGFKKVVLNSGETQQITISIPAKSLSFFDAKSGSWQLEPGIFNLLVGTSSRKIVKTISTKIVTL